MRFLPALLSFCARSQVSLTAVCLHLLVLLSRSDNVNNSSSWRDHHNSHFAMTAMQCSCTRKDSLSHSQSRCCAGSSGWWVALTLLHSSCSDGWPDIPIIVLALGQPSPDAWLSVQPRIEKEQQLLLCSYILLSQSIVSAVLSTWQLFVAADFTFNLLSVCDAKMSSIHILTSSGNIKIENAKLIRDVIVSLC